MISRWLGPSCWKIVHMCYMNKAAAKIFGGAQTLNEMSRRGAPIANSCWKSCGGRVRHFSGLMRHLGGARVAGVPLCDDLIPKHNRPGESATHRHGMTTSH